MPLRTADCVEAICQYYKDRDNHLSSTKNWKRITKRGNKEKGFLREFRNVKDCEVRAFVKSTESKITKITVQRTPFNVFCSGGGDSSSEEVVKDVDNLHAYLRKILESNPSGYDPGISDIIYGAEFKNLPKAPPPPEDEMDEYYDPNEDIDFENREICALTKDSITLWAGGDWQQPVVFKCVYEGGRLKCVESEPAGAYRNHTEMRFPEVLKILYGTEDPEPLRKFKEANS